MIASIVGYAHIACAQQANTTLPLAQQQTYAPQWQNPFTMQGNTLPWPHEIRVSLPPTYFLEPDTTFPVIWLTDGATYFGTASEMASLYATLDHMPHVIVVSVGQNRSETRANFQQKRVADFLFEDYQPFDTRNADDPVLRSFLEQNPDADLDAQRRSFAFHGGAFLDFLVDELRPALARKYRFADDHTIFGHSGGSMFLGRAMFARPEAFDRYIMSSGLSYDALQAEARYADGHADLAARIFIAAGDSEAETAARASQRLVSNTVRFGENLVLREYASLEVEVRLYRDKNHATVPATVLSEALLWAFSDP